MINQILSKPTKIKLSVISIFSISIIIITNHSLSVLGISLPFGLKPEQPIDVNSHLFSILINLFLLFTVWLKIRTKTFFIPHLTVNIFIVVRVEIDSITNHMSHKKFISMNLYKILSVVTGHDYF